MHWHTGVLEDMQKTGIIEEVFLHEGAHVSLEGYYTYVRSKYGYRV